MPVIKISMEEYEHHNEGSYGVCLGCGEWIEGDCEPDTRNRVCDACEAPRVFGCEEALMMGALEIA